MSNRKPRKRLPSAKQTRTSDSKTVVLLPPDSNTPDDALAYFHEDQVNRPSSEIDRTPSLHSCCSALFFETTQDER